MHCLLAIVMRGGAVISIDADGQQSPKLIPDFIKNGMGASKSLLVFESTIQSMGY